MDFTIAKADESDRAAILRVMEHWNMHRVPSPEMAELDIGCFFVARVDGRVVGAAGYQVLSDGEGKTTLLGVLPEFAGAGIGRALQEARLEALWAAGVRRVYSNADRPASINWYKKHFGYRPHGTQVKLCPFGDPAIPQWTTLVVDLSEYRSRRATAEARKRAYIAANDPHPLAPYPPLVINVCLTGMVPMPARAPFTPVSPEAIIEDALTVFDCGARVVHLHARDQEGRPTPDARVYESIIATLHRERPGIVCCVTTSGRNWSELDRRSEVLDLTGAAKPDMASLTLGSLNFLSGPSVNALETVEALAFAMRERGIKPELEVFDLGMIHLAKYLERHGIIGGVKVFNILLGNLNTAPATLGALAALTQALPDDSVWAAAGLGPFQLPMNTAAIVAGGHVRVGIEDAMYLDYEQTQPASNRALVERITRLAKEFQRPIASPAEARAMLGLEEADTGA